MTETNDSNSSVVEVRPEVVFLYELLDQLTTGLLRIPRFQRPFVWRRDQMTDLLDSVYNQYPIGSLLVWETDESIATLGQLGPFVFPSLIDGPVGYLLDGHQRLATLAGALVPRSSNSFSEDERDPGRWDMSWNMETRRFQHGLAESDPKTLFPLTSLLDTLRFFDAVGNLRRSLAGQEDLAGTYTEEVSRLAREFQHYRIPVIRIRRTGLSEAVEIFARLNSKGQAMSSDQMVSALMYRQGQQGGEFDLASEIDEISNQLAERSFGDIDRTTILRGILANLDEDIYRTDWTRLTHERRERLLPRLREGVDRTSQSFDLAMDFLADNGVYTSRLLPYAMQLVLLSSFLDRDPVPSEDKVRFLSRWFWASSFSGWFGGANTARVSSLVSEFREIAQLKEAPKVLNNFNMDATSLPFPSSFDMRSARTRALLLVMLSLKPRNPDGTLIEDPWRDIAEKGPSAVGHIFGELPRSLTGNPANRMIRPPGAGNGLLYPWISRNLPFSVPPVLESHALTREAVRLLNSGDVAGFVNSRQELLIAKEREFQGRFGVKSSALHVGKAPVDTD